MNQCPTCKAVLEPGVRFCPNDGTPLTDTAAVRGGTLTPTGARPPSSVVLNLPTVVGGRYKLMELRGGGGMAKVYKAEDQTLQRTVAVKLINPELRSEAEFDARFQREARIASQLQDPHIVAVHDFGLDPTLGPFLVMEYLEGQSLRERLATGGPLPVKAAIQISGQMMLALMHAHEKGIVHRDIKPDNIFLMSQSGVRMHARVLDFGIARILRSDDPGHGMTLTSPGAVLGTPRYMSPEQLAGQPLDARSDIFSAALVIYESLTGQLPYVSGKKLIELCPDATPVLQDLLEHCLKPAASDRPQTAVEVYLRLQELGKASGVLLMPPGAIEAILRARKTNTPAGGQAPAPTVPYGQSAAGSSSRRRVLIVGAVLLAVLGAAIFAGLHFWPKPKSETESLLGVHIGDGRKETTSRLSLEHTRPWERWLQKPGDVSIGAALNPETDLGVSKDNMDGIDVAWNDDKKVVALFHRDKLLALIVHEPRAAASQRDVHIGESDRSALAKYADADMQNKEAKAEEEKRAIRCDRLGLGFDIHKGKVIAITLYPPKTEK